MLLMNYGEPGEGVDVDPKMMEETMNAMAAYTRALNEAGVLIAATVLQPSNTTRTVTRRSGSLVVENGPFADTKEALGGLFIIDVADEDSAIGWAEKCPMSEFGVTEVRQSASHVENGEWQR